MRQSDRETRVFDPALGFAPLIDVIEVTDSALARRGDRWWMYLAGEAAGHEGIRLFSASLPAGAPLRAHGWRLTPDPGDRHGSRSWPRAARARPGTCAAGATVRAT